MSFLGIDYGSKKIGLAVSDKDGQFAFPLAVLKNDAKIIVKIAKIIKEKNIKKIILGLPLRLDDSPTSDTKAAGNFKLKLEKMINPVRNSHIQPLSKLHSHKSGGSRVSNGVKIPVIFEKEFFTTKEAERIQGKHKKIDASAAALILKNYLSHYLKNSQFYP